MTISEYTLTQLAKVICGDVEYTPYMGGRELVQFFNKFGFNEVYGEGFPSRWRYTEEKIRELNGTEKLRKVIEDLVDPRRFSNFSFTVQNAVREMNELIKFDNFQLIESGFSFKLATINNQIIEPETIKEINHEFITQQIFKCQNKISNGDYNGAITNARSLVEAVFIEIIERCEGMEIKNNGDIENLWKRVKKVMKLEVDRAALPEFVIQILTGIETAIKGLAGLSNNAGDRHATKFKTRKHHAKLAVNLAMTISDFLMDSLNFKLLIIENT